MGDLDNDGRMDAVISVLNGPAKVLHNRTGGTRQVLRHVAADRVVTVTETK